MIPLGWWWKCPECTFRGTFMASHATTPKHNVASLNDTSSSETPAATGMRLLFEPTPWALRSPCGWQKLSCLLWWRCCRATAVRAPSLLLGTALLLGTPLCSSPGTGAVSVGPPLHRDPQPQGCTTRGNHNSENHACAQRKCKREARV